MLTDVRVDLTGYFSARHFGAAGFFEEGGEFAADKSRFDEARRRAVASFAFAFLAGFLRRTEFAVRAFLKSAKTSSERRKLGTERSKITHESVERIIKRRFGVSGFNRFRDFFGDRSRSRGGQFGGLGRGFLSCFGHLILYYNETFLSVFLVKYILTLFSAPLVVIKVFLKFHKLKRKKLI